MFANLDLKRDLARDLNGGIIRQRPSQVGLADIPGLGVGAQQDDVAQVGTPQVGLGQVCAGHVGAGHDAVLELGPRQTRTPQDCACEVRANGFKA